MHSLDDFILRSLVSHIYKDPISKEDDGYKFTGLGFEHFFLGSTLHFSTLIVPERLNLSLRIMKHLQLTSMESTGVGQFSASCPPDEADKASTSSVFSWGL